MSKVDLIVAALQEELQSEFNDKLTCITGVGKVNATHALMATLYKSNQFADRVINFGTAVSKNLKPGSIVQALGFYQYDMKCAPLTGSIGITPFEDHPTIISQRLFEDIPAFICGTGDTFIEQGHPALQLFEICDMESYALAKVCQREKVPFYSFKYITDSGSTEDWKANLPHAAKEFRKIYDRIRCLT